MRRRAFLLGTCAALALLNSASSQSIGGSSGISNNVADVPTPSLGTEIAAGAGLGGNQYQQTLAVNPLNANQIAITCKTGSAETATAIICTQNGGITWNATALASGGNTGDPSCVYDNLGNLHIFFIDRDTGGLGYQKSTDGGVTLSAVATIIASTVVDHPVCGIDNTNGAFANSVYVVGRTSPNINLAYSRDHGATWTEVSFNAGSIIPASPQTGALGGGFCSGLTVMPDGTLIFPAVNAETFVTEAALQEFYALISSNGGVSLSAVDVGIWDQPFSATGPQYGFGASNAANKGSTVYFLYTQQSPSTPTALEMYKSSNDGALWSGPTTIYTPATGFTVISMCIMVNKAGIIGVSFFEGDDAETMFNIKFIYSLDGGVTWSAPLLVSSAPSNYLTSGEPRTPGQDQVYSNVDANGNFCIVWSDARGAATVYTTYMRKIAF